MIDSIINSIKEYQRALQFNAQALYFLKSFYEFDSKFSELLKVLSAVKQQDQNKESDYIKTKELYKKIVDISQNLVNKNLFEKKNNQNKELKDTTFDKIWELNRKKEELDSLKSINDEWSTDFFYQLSQFINSLINIPFISSNLIKMRRAEAAKASKEQEEYLAPTPPTSPIPTVESEEQRNKENLSSPLPFIVRLEEQTTTNQTVETQKILNKVVEYQYILESAIRLVRARTPEEQNIEQNEKENSDEDLTPTPPATPTPPNTPIFSATETITHLTIKPEKWQKFRLLSFILLDAYNFFVNLKYMNRLGRSVALYKICKESISQLENALHSAENETYDSGILLLLKEDLKSLQEKYELERAKCFCDRLENMDIFKEAKKMVDEEKDQKASVGTKKRSSSALSLGKATDKEGEEDDKENIPFRKKRTTSETGPSTSPTHPLETNNNKAPVSSSHRSNSMPQLFEFSNKSVNPSFFFKHRSNTSPDLRRGLSHIFV